MLWLFHSHFITLTVKYTGCYRDNKPRAIPGKDGKDVLIRDYYRKRVDAVSKCALVALRFGFRVFAVQHQGWCATGPRAHRTYHKYGRSKRCRNGKGGPLANDVYTIYGKDLENAPFKMHSYDFFIHKLRWRIGKGIFRFEQRVQKS